MPTFEFKSPDGKTYEIQAPDGATKEQAFEVLQRQINPGAPPAAEKPLQDPIAMVTGVPQRSESQQEHKGDWQQFKQKVASWFEPRQPEVAGAGEIAGEVGGATAGGAVAGAVLPAALQAGGKAMQAGGKFVPGLPGRVVQGVGMGAEALGKATAVVPAGQRMAQGAAGGAVGSAVDIGGKAMGASKAATFGASTVAGGAADLTAGYAAAQATKLIKFAASIGAEKTLGQAPVRVLSVGSAKELQKQLFGERTEGYVEGLIGSENRIATQEALRKADPSLNGAGPQVAGPTQMAQPVPGSGGPVPGTAVGPVNPTGTALGPLNPQPAAVDGFGNAKAAAMSKAQAASAQSKKQGEQLASTIYRERMFEGVTQATANGHYFSDTPAFGAFAGQLQAQVALGNIRQAEANKLLRTLAQDKSTDPLVKKGWAEAVDNRIREWGKPGEVGGQVGAAAIPAQAAKDVREALRNSYGEYLKQVGLGDIEKKYRGAYQAEMIAEAKDKLPHFLYGFGAGKEFDRFARNLAKDPAGKEFIQRGLMNHLANQEPQNVMREFNKLQTTLVNAELVTPAHISQLRTAAEQVQKTLDQGAKLKAAQRFKQIVMMTAVEKAAQEVGGRAGGQREAP